MPPLTPVCHGATETRVEPGWRSSRSTALHELGHKVPVADRSFDWDALHTSVVYQPVIEVTSGQTIGVEALARFDRQDWSLGGSGAIASTAEIIRRAEMSGHMVDLGRRIARDALRGWWQFSPCFVLSLNVSSAELAADDYAEFLLGALPGGCRVEVEITETSIQPIDQTALANLRTLRAHGVTVSIDDFGEGYNDLRRVLEVPCDRLKLSQRMVRDLGRCRRAATVALSILRLARDLGVSTTAEGIETTEQFDWLASRGCDCVQGYLLAKPMSIQALRRWSRVQ